MDAKLKQSMTDLIQAINKSGDEAVERAKAGVQVIATEAYEPPGVTDEEAAKRNATFVIAMPSLQGLSHEQLCDMLAAIAEERRN